VPAATAWRATKFSKHTKFTKKITVVLLVPVAAAGHGDKMVFFVAFVFFVSFVVSRPPGLQ
jgi:hypothetical protein